MNTLVKLKKQLEQVESRLEKHRAACADIHGNGTMRKAKHSRNWDYYAQLKIKLQGQIEEAEWDDYADKTRSVFYCPNCQALLIEECVCE